MTYYFWQTSFLETQGGKIAENHEPHTESRTMKTKIAALVAAIISTVIPSIANASPPINNDNIAVETKGPVTIGWYSASLPREDASGTAQGVSWPVASANWMQAIRTDAVVGSGHTGVQNIAYNDYLGMTTSTTFNSWRGTTSADGEFGNRQHFGFKVSTQTGYFIPASITYVISSQVWNGSGWVNAIYSNVSASMAMDNNPFRVRLNPGTDGLYGTSDDAVSAVQTTSTQTNAFIFGGYGIGVGAYGSGTSQDKLNNVLSYMQANWFRVVLTVSVPHSDGNTYTFNNVYMPPQQGANNTSLVYVPFDGETSASLNWSTTLGGLFEIQKSPDLVNWTPVGMVSGSGLLTFLAQDQSGGAPMFFYRTRRW